MTRVKALGGYPIEQHSSPNIGGWMTGHKGLVLHIAEGTYRGTISWQMNPDQRYGDGTSVTTSSTFIVGREPGEWAQMVDTDRIAWCQRSGSYDWLSIELAGYAPNPPTAWQIEACAQLLAWAHEQYGVPLQVTSSTGTRGLGHHSMDNDTTVQWGHDSCPGAGVINAKSAIVARARAILTPPQEDDMPTADEVASAVWGRQMKDPTDDSVHPVGDYVRFIEFNVQQQLQPVLAKLDEVTAKLAELDSKLTG